MVLKMLSFIISLLYFHSVVSCQYLNCTDDLSINESKHIEILSRKKRFLIFPEGSSIQLVFCLTYPMIFEIGDIFLYGYTAALAYELPQDPYSPFNHKADPLHRRQDTKTIYFTNEKGKVLFQKPYKKKPIVNPAFAKRSLDSQLKGKKQLKKQRQRMHSLRRELLQSEHIPQHRIQYHRTGRAALYRKIETMFEAMGGKGRQCLLKTLCVVGQIKSSTQGAFLQEILRAVFTLPEGEFEDSYNKEYDIAFTATAPCDTLYPQCNEPISDPTSANFNY